MPQLASDPERGVRPYQFRWRVLSGFVVLGGKEAVFGDCPSTAQLLREVKPTLVEGREACIEHR